jgi:hypothetical protein
MFLNQIGFQHLVYYSHCSVAIQTFFWNVFFISVCDTITKKFKTVNLINNFVIDKNFVVDGVSSLEKTINLVFTIGISTLSYELYFVTCILSTALHPLSLTG